VEKAKGRGLVAVRLRVLECVEKEGVTEASRRFGMSRPTLYKLAMTTPESVLPGWGLDC
jgi:hypothetical protein